MLLFISTSIEVSIYHSMYALANFSTREGNYFANERFDYCCPPLLTSDASCFHQSDGISPFGNL